MKNQVLNECHFIIRSGNIHTRMKTYTGVVWLFSLISAATPSLLAETGEDVIFNITLPQITQDEREITLAFHNRSSLIFTTKLGNSSPTTYDNTYKQRVNVTTCTPGTRCMFILYKVTREDAGKYVCLNKEKSVISYCGEYLVITGKPTKPVIVSEYREPIITLYCSSQSTSLPPDHNLTISFEWRKNSQPIENSDSQLVTANNKLEQEANYSCRSREEGGQRSDWSDDYYGPMKLQLSPDKKIVRTENGLLEVQCSADCNPPCNVTWWNTKLSVVVSVSTNMSTLNVNRSEAGSYRCDVSNVFGKKSREINITDLYVPYISSFTAKGKEKLVLHEGDAVTFQCAVNGVPSPNVSVISTVTNMSLPDCRGHELGLECTINSTQCLNGGQYHCHAANSEGETRSRTVDVKVKCAPVISSFTANRKQKLVVHEGDAVTFQCAVNGVPFPTFSVISTVTNMSLPDCRVHDLGFECTVDSTQCLNGGQYHCHATNSEGETRSRTVDVEVVCDEKQSGFPFVIFVSVCVFLCGIVVAIGVIWIKRYRKGKGGERYRVQGEVEDNGSYIYAGIKKKRKKTVSDEYATVKKSRPKACNKNPMAPENQVLICNEGADGMSGNVNNNCGEKNADGLAYADLDLPPPTMQDGRPVVIKNEETVVYEQIDFSQTPGPQLPEKIWEKEKRL